jgi:hypothetical protein
MVDHSTLPTSVDADPYERVREITEALQHRPDPDAERVLPHLQLDATEGLRDVAPRTPWPPAIDDPFPDVSGRLPEITGAQLSAETLGGGLLHHGAVLVRRMLAADDVDRIRPGMDRTIAARAIAEAGTDHEGGAPWYIPFRPSKKTAGQKGKPHLVRLVDAPRVLPDVLATYRRLGLLGAIESYLGDPPVFTANKSVLRYLERPQFVPSDYHQDGRFMDASVRAANVWVTLTDCGTDAPTLDLIPRREPTIHPTGNGNDGLDWTLSEREVDQLAGDTPVVRLELEAGDGVLFDHFLVHRSAYSPAMTKMRQAIEFWFFAPSHAPKDYQLLRA